METGKKKRIKNTLLEYDKFSVKNAALSIKLQGSLPTTIYVCNVEIQLLSRL